MKDKGGLGIADESHWIPVRGPLQSREASCGMKESDPRFESLLCLLLAVTFGRYIASPL